jgi:hypothetical protein
MSNQPDIIVVNTRDARLAGPGQFEDLLPNILGLKTITLESAVIPISWSSFHPTENTFSITLTPSMSVISVPIDTSIIANSPADIVTLINDAFVNVGGYFPGQYVLRYDSARGLMQFYSTIQAGYVNPTPLAMKIGFNVNTNFQNSPTPPLFSSANNGYAQCLPKVARTSCVYVVSNLNFDANVLGPGSTMINNIVTMIPCTTTQYGDVLSYDAALESAGLTDNDISPSISAVQIQLLDDQFRTIVIPPYTASMCIFQFRCGYREPIPII